MTDIHQNSQDHDLVLPTYIGYHHWTKQLVKEKVERDPLIQKATVYDDKYRFCRNTIAIYNFENNPVFGKYKTVIIDYKKGFVLYKKARVQFYAVTQLVHCLVDYIYKSSLHAT